MTEHRGAETSKANARSDRNTWMPERGSSPVDRSRQVVLPGYRDFVLIAHSDSSEVYRAHQEGVDRPVGRAALSRPLTLSGERSDTTRQPINSRGPTPRHTIRRPYIGEDRLNAHRHVRELGGPTRRDIA
jgi:hypothetical protein